ncbi:DUF397 domain-containing protein [Streptomyces sp. NPDC050145]|uniref:DUF397 domain-containing protein n=1 Tax=Streptomyces sp. NPDC050145 TaxID=3365602 RepID=UPI0037A1A073
MTWQKSSYCGEGESCVHVSASPDAIHMTESSDPTGTVLTTTRADFGQFVRILKDEPITESPFDVSVAAEDTDLLHIRTRAVPKKVVTTTRAQWSAFVLGVRADEFDHFAAPPH